MRRSADTRCAVLQHGTQMLKSMYAMTTVQILRWSQSLSGPIHVTAPVIAVKFRRKSRKFFLYLDSYGETRPSSSKYGRKIATRRCELVMEIDTRGIVTCSRRVSLCRGRIRGCRERQIATDRFQVSGFPETWKSAKVYEERLPRTNRTQNVEL
jgi:hypothetical protein